MNQGIGRHSYLKHWAIAMGLLLLTAILGAQIQNHYASGHLGILVFGLIAVLGCLFSLLFAWLQLETRNSYFSTGWFVGFLSLYLLLCLYLEHTVSIDWAAVSAGEMQLTWYQKMIRSDLTFWIGFLLPFVFSVMYFSIRSKK